MKYSKGFSLIELMIVLAIIGILSSIAFGFYGNYVIASNRSEGRAALTEAAATLEKCKSMYGSFNNANCNYADFTSDTGYYGIAVVRDGVSFTLTATPAGPQVNDTDCTSMTLTNTGIKGGSPATNECW